MYIDFYSEVAQLIKQLTTVYMYMYNFTIAITVTETIIYT